MKLGIVGSGLIVRTLFDFVDTIKDIEIIAICGTKKSESILNDMAKWHNIKYIYTDFDNFLANNEFSTVYVALPNQLHYQYAKKALELNKNVILEKPFTATYKEAVELSKIADEKNLILLEAISNQFNPNYLKIKDLLKEIGKVKIVSLNYTQYSSRYDAFKKGEIHPVFDSSKSGGALMDLNVYNIHFMIGLFGLPKQVHYYPNMERAVDTSGILIMEYDTFQSVLIAAKDCTSPFVNSIQGENGAIYTSSPLFSLTDFSIEKAGSNTERYDLTNGKHRMYHEFIEFAKIIDNKNIEKAKLLKKHTLDVMKVIAMIKD